MENATPASATLAAFGPLTASKGRVLEAYDGGCVGLQLMP